MTHDRSLSFPKKNTTFQTQLRLEFYSKYDIPVVGDAETD